MKASNLVEGNSKPILVYILSHSYSGSTLLTRLMACHPEISSIGELKATSMGDVSTYKCSCGKYIKECDFWDDLSDRLNKNSIKFSLSNFQTRFRSQSKICDLLLHSNIRKIYYEVLRDYLISLSSRCSKTLNDILYRNKIFIEEINKIQGGEVFLDGSKEPTRLKHFIKSGIFNIFIIYLVRDGRGIACSSMKHDGLTIQQATKKWLFTQNGIDNFIHQNKKEKLIEIKYEDLCANPTETLDRIYSFIGLNKESINIDYSLEKSHILGNSMRLGSLNEIQLDEKWRKQLSKEEIEVFEKMAGIRNRLLEYF